MYSQLNRLCTYSIVLFPLLIKPRVQLLRYGLLSFLSSHRAPISTLWPEATAKFDKANEELNVYNFYIPFP
jgi:hypothetical protein